ncbi:putative transcription factor [Drosera capensis]
MASKSKRPLQFTNPSPSDSSSDEEEEDEEVHPTPQPSEKPKPIKSKPPPPPEEESDEEDDEDDEGEDEKKSSPLPLTQKQQQTTQKNPKEDSSSDEDDEEDESDSSEEDEEKKQKGSEKPKPGAGTEPVVPVPIRSKSMNSKPVVKPGQVGQGNQSKKRPVSPVAAEKVGKRVKGGGKEEEVGKKVPRIWSEEDEIVLLEGVLEFQRKNGVSVSSDPGRFHETVKDKFSMSVDKTLLKEKLRRLKDKYNRMKGSEGKSPDVSSKPHDGSENVKKKVVSAATPGKSGKKGSANGSNVVVGMKSACVNGGNVSFDGEIEAPMVVDVAKVVPPREDRLELTELYPHLMRALKSCKGIVGSGAVSSSISVLSESELKGLDDRWKKMTKTELQLYMKEMDRRKEEADFLKEQANLEHRGHSYEEPLGNQIHGSSRISKRAGQFKQANCMAKLLVL